MEKQEEAKKLSSLAQLDIDAIHAYDQAIKKIEVPEVQHQLTQFRQDHENHYKELSAIIRELGESPPEYSPDFKGYIIKGFTSLQSASGTEGALKAMQGNEKLTNKQYKDAQGWGLIPMAQAVVEKGYGDERTHLKYIEQALEKRIWEGKGTDV